MVYPGATHSFAMVGINVTEGDHHMVYDSKAAEDAQARADAFIAAHGPATP